MPLLMVVVSPAGALVPVVSGASLVFLALLGAVGARAGGANVVHATARVTFWGALAMALTAPVSGSLSARLSEGCVYSPARDLTRTSTDIPWKAVIPTKLPPALPAGCRVQRQRGWDWSRRHCGWSVQGRGDTPQPRPARVPIAWAAT